MLQSDSGQLTRLAIIGYGLIGQRHAEAIKAAPRVELAAIVEPEGSASAPWLTSRSRYLPM